MSSRLESFVEARGSESVRALLAELHAHRVATMRPEDLAVNINQRKLLVDTADRSRFVKIGDVVEPFDLPEVAGGRVTLQGLLAKGPAVLVFFRFAACPACNIALPYYQRQLHPRLRDLGASLVAISPQVPERLIDIKQRHDFEFLVASDLNNELGRKFGILYTSDEPSQRAALAKGKSIGEITGTGTWQLPMPTVLVIDRDRVVRFADVAPDWLLRTEADVVIDAVRALRASSTSGRSAIPA
jgi:peroxiredoxin